MTTSRASEPRRLADPHALSPALRRHLSLVAPPTPAEEKALAAAIVDVRRLAWVAALSDPARSPAALRAVVGAEHHDSPLAQAADGLAFQQWADACASAARSRPASVARSYVPGMAAMLASVLAARHVDPTDDLLTTAIDNLHVDPPRRPSPAHAAAFGHLADLAAKVRALADRNLRLVVKMAHDAHWSRRGDEAASTLTVEDLISHGVDGLARGIRGFDPALGFRLSTYMGTWVQSSINRAIANVGRMIRLPVHLSDTMRKVVRTARELAASIGREPTPEEVAAAIGRPSAAGVATVRGVLGGEVPRHVASLDAPVGSVRSTRNDTGDEGLENRIDRLASDDMNPEEALIAAEEADVVRRAVAGLARGAARDIIERRYLGAASEDVSLKSIADDLGVSKQAVHASHDKAIVRLRRTLRNNGIVARGSC